MIFIFKSLQHIRTWVSACARETVPFHRSRFQFRARQLFRGLAAALFSRKCVIASLSGDSARTGWDFLAETGAPDDPDEIWRHCARARWTEGSSRIPASVYDGYVSSLALWLSRRWRVASVCFRGVRRVVTARRTPPLPLPLPPLPLPFPLPPTTFSQFYPLIFRFYQPAPASLSQGNFIQPPVRTSKTVLCLFLKFGVTASKQKAKKQTNIQINNNNNRNKTKPKTKHSFTCPLSPWF